MTNSNVVAVTPNQPSVAGAYIQPTTGAVIVVTTDADVNGNLQQSVVGPNAGLAYFGTSNYRDAQITVQNGSSASHPSAGGTIVSLTPGTAGLWEVVAQVGIGGTTAILVDTNNFQLLSGGGTVITTVTYPVTSTTGSGVATLPGVILNLGTATALLVTAAGASTAGSIYSATLVARRVG
jgi:hypothetical protein